MAERKKVPGQWWGEYVFEAGESGFWEVGALRLWIQRGSQEWRIIHTSTDDPHAAGVDVRVPDEGGSPPPELEIHRYGVRETHPPLHLKPVLPDRPVVSKPETPFHVLAESETEVYISSPVWLAAEAGKPVRPLIELPLYRSSDTWFGANTREGEFCYASRTSCRHSLADLPPRPQRVVTPVRIRNRSDKTLQIERLNLPVPYLSVYAAPDGGLWTLPVTVVVEQEQGRALIEIGKKVEGAVPGAKQVSPPRIDEGLRLFNRALGALIG